MVSKASAVHARARVTASHRKNCVGRHSHNGANAAADCQAAETELGAARHAAPALVHVMAAICSERAADGGARQ